MQQEWYKNEKGIKTLNLPLILTKMQDKNAKKIGKKYFTFKSIMSIQKHLMERESQLIGSVQAKI